jgi:hypothetical protein
MINVRRIFRLQEIGNRLAETSFMPVRIEKRADSTLWVLDDFGRPRLVSLAHAA